MIVMVTLINNGGDLEEREEIVWSRLVLLEKNTDPWQTIDDDDEEESEEEEVQILLDNHFHHNESDNDFDDGVNDDDDADDLYSCKAS